MFYIVCARQSYSAQAENNAFSHCNDFRSQFHASAVERQFVRLSGTVDMVRAQTVTASS